MRVTGFEVIRRASSRAWSLGPPPCAASGRGPQVREFRAFLRRHSEPELVEVAGASFGEGLAAGPVWCGGAKFAWLALSRVALAVARMTPVPANFSTDEVHLCRAPARKHCTVCISAANPAA